jgi:type VI secretion system secreted protein VgrG
MPDLDANAARFAFLPSQLDADAFTLVRFTGTEAISNLFAFEVALVGQSPDVDFAQVVNRPATLTVDRDGAAVPVCGIVTALEQTGRVGKHVAYRATLRPRLWRLSLTRQSRIFQEESVEAIITEVLQGAGFQSADFRFALTGTYAPRAYCVQYQESDLAFIRRLMEFEGIAFFFEHTDDGDVLVMTDDRSGHAMIDGPTTLRYAEGAGLARDVPEHVAAFAYRETMTPGTVTLRDYNYETPDTDLQARATAADEMPGEHYEHGAKYAATEQGRRLAAVRAEAAACRRVTFAGRSDSAGLRAGYRFSLSDHYRADLSEDYLVVAVEHHGSQQQALGLAGLDLPGVRPFGPEDDAGRRAPDGSVYRNAFECIPAAVPFRPARTTPVPTLPGLTTARVETAGGTYAYVDEAGRYRAKMHFDRSPRTDGTATKPIRLTTPNSGPGYGIHFPNHADTELVVAHVNGDADRPLALGTVPNPSQQSPTVSENRMQNVIRTFGGNELVMDDTTDAAQVRLQSAEQHQLLMDDKDDRLQLVTTGGHVVRLDDKNERIEVQSTKGHKILLDDKSGVMSLVTEAGHYLHLSDEEDCVTVADADGKHVLTLDYAGATMTLVTEGDIGLEAAGAVAIKGETVRIESAKDTTVEAGGALTQTAGENATLEAGRDATVAAGQRLTAEGAQAAILTAMDVTVEGSQRLTATGGLQAELSGTQLKVEGQAMAEIKSALLKLNG